jgi:hypothetical protein
VKKTGDGSPRFPHCPACSATAGIVMTRSKVQALALRVIAERLEHRKAPAELLNLTFKRTLHARTDVMSWARFTENGAAP